MSVQGSGGNATPAAGQGDPTLIRALENHKSGRLTAAKHLYDRVLRRQPNHAVALHLLGLISQQQGEPERALGLMRRALALQPDYAEAHHDLGIVLEDLGRHEEAVASYRQALALKPDFAASHSNLGAALLDLRRPNEAERALRAALELDPSRAETHNNLGFALSQQRRWGEAEEAFHRAIALKADLASAHHNLGNVLRRSGRPEQARVAFRRALELEPENTEVLYADALLHDFSAGDAEMARLQALAARTDLSAAESCHMSFALGKAHDDIGAFDEAFAHFARANELRRAATSADPASTVRRVDEVISVFDAPPKPSGGPVERLQATPIFIFGLSRSGKSLVESVLAGHPAVYGADETRDFLNALGAVAETYDLPQPYPRYVAELTAAHLVEIGARYLGLVGQYAGDATTISNTLPGHTFYLGLIADIFPKASLIHCVRDPIDNCLQLYFKCYREGSQRYSYDLATAAHWHNQQQRLMAHWHELLGERILTVRYEDLVRQPSVVVERLFQHCGLDRDPESPPQLHDREIGRWCHYERHLGELRKALSQTETSPASR